MGSGYVLIVFLATNTRGRSSVWHKYSNIASNETINVTDAQESQATVRNLQLPSVSQPGYCIHSPSVCVPLISAYDLLCRSGHAPILDQVLPNNCDEGIVLYMFTSGVVGANEIRN